jgi:hypothetical protein
MMPRAAADARHAACDGLALEEEPMNTLRRELNALGWILRMVTFGLVAAAVYKELQLPADKRTWHGRLFDMVPYDFRMPTPRKLISAWWNPDSNNVFSEQPFGVGWTINVGALIPMVRDRFGSGPAEKPTKARRRSSRAKAD